MILEGFGTLFLKAASFPDAQPMGYNAWLTQVHKNISLDLQVSTAVNANILYIIIWICLEKNYYFSPNGGRRLQQTVELILRTAEVNRDKH